MAEFKELKDEYNGLQLKTQRNYHYPTYIVGTFVCFYFPCGDNCLFYLSRGESKEDELKINVKKNVKKCDHLT